MEDTMRNLRILAVACLVALSGGARASDNPAMDAAVDHIDSEWARIKYQVRDKDQQFRQMQALAGQAAAVVARYPGRAEPLLWQGIVTSEEAGMAGMFQKLGFATAARDILHKAEQIDPKVLKGGVPMSLGVLYYRVPGFPIGFGSNAKAQAYLKAALALDPNGLDANYFYGDYLYTRSDYAGAKAYFEKALRAPANPQRPLWYAGRRADVRAELAKAQAHL
jgi:tetratricopeptide (TPR) repeat protein